MNSAFTITSKGPLPLQAQFESHVEGSALVFLCGSGYRSGSAGFAGVSLTIDGVPVTQSQIFVNERNSHHAVPPVFVEIPISAGPHTLGVSMTNGDMSTDANDVFSAAVFFF